MVNDRELFQDNGPWAESEERFAAKARAMLSPSRDDVPCEPRLVSDNHLRRSWMWVDPPRAFTLSIRLD
jgi:hypothetical protein